MLLAMTLSLLPILRPPPPPKKRVIVGASGRRASIRPLAAVLANACRCGGHLQCLRLQGTASLRALRSPPFNPFLTRSDDTPIADGRDRDEGPGALFPVKQDLLSLIWDPRLDPRYFRRPTELFKHYSTEIQTNVFLICKSGPQSRESLRSGSPLGLVRGTVGYLTGAGFPRPLQVLC